MSVGESIQPGHGLTITLTSTLPFAEYSVRKMILTCVSCILNLTLYICPPIILFTPWFFCHECLLHDSWSLGIFASIIGNYCMHNIMEYFKTFVFHFAKII